jgi:hypothetical protein
MRLSDPQGTGPHWGRPWHRLPQIYPSDPLGWGDQVGHVPRSNDAAEEADWESAWIDLGGEG